MRAPDEHLSADTRVVRLAGGADTQLDGDMFHDLDVSRRVLGRPEAAAPEARLGQNEVAGTDHR